MLGDRQLLPLKKEKFLNIFFFQAVFWFVSLMLSRGQEGK